MGAVGGQQPAVAVPGDASWRAAYGRLFAALNPANQAWAGAASALVLVAARTAADNGAPQPWALYDTGQAVASLVTQAQAHGLAVHQIGGFDSDAVRAEFGLDQTLTPVVVLAVGRADPEAELPSHLADREAAPRTRHPVSDLLLAERRPATATLPERSPCPRDGCRGCGETRCPGRTAA